MSLDTGWGLGWAGHSFARHDVAKHFRLVALEKDMTCRNEVLLGLLLACGLAAPAMAQEPKTGGVINAVIQPEPPGLMLAMIQNGPTQMVSGNIFEGLLRYSPKLEPLPEPRRELDRQRGRQDLHLQAQEGCHLA